VVLCPSRVLDLGRERARRFEKTRSAFSARRNVETRVRVETARFETATIARLKGDARARSRSRRESRIVTAFSTGAFDRRAVHFPINRRDSLVDSESKRPLRAESAPIARLRGEPGNLASRKLVFFGFAKRTSIRRSKDLRFLSAASRVEKLPNVWIAGVKDFRGP
jgi:hypothetical protein